MDAEFMPRIDPVNQERWNPDRNILPLKAVVFDDFGLSSPRDRHSGISGLNHDAPI
jgi:hypothetical protein